MPSPSSSHSSGNARPPSLILNRRHLEHVLRVYVDHHNRERPHRALELRPPQPQPRTKSAPSEIHRRDRLGGLIHEYYREAA
jgi:putative transposase